MEQQRQTYHHKDLRNALIETGIQIVNTEGGSCGVWCQPCCPL